MMELQVDKCGIDANSSRRSQRNRCL